MAVELTATSANFVGTGVSSTYAAPIYANSAAQIVVSVNGVKKTLGDDYVLNGLGAATGISIVATFAVGAAVYVERVTPITQLVDTRNNETILEDVLDASFDKLTMMIQERAGETGRALLVPKGEAGYTLPSAGLRAQRLLVGSALGAIVASSFTVDQIEQVIGNALGPQLAQLAANITFTGRNSVIGRSVNDRLGDWINALDYIPTSLHAAIRNYTSTVDVTAYVQAACVAANGGIVAGAGPGGTVYFPNGRYNVSQVGIRDTRIEGQSRDGTIFRGVAGGNANIFMFDACLDRDGVTVNTVGNGNVEHVKIDATGSGRSGLRTFGGGQFIRDVWVYGAQTGFLLGLPIRSCYDGLRAENCQIVGIKTYSNPGDTATSATFNACLATGCYRGIHITQLGYSTFVNCVAEISSEINWYIDGTVVPLYSLTFIVPATEGSGYPFLFRTCRDITIIGPRIISPDGTGDLMQLDNFQGAIINYSTPGPVPGGRAHLNILNAPADGLIGLVGCTVSFANYATMRRACSIFGSDPSTGFVTTSGKRFEIDTPQNVERTYFEIGNIDGFSGTKHAAGDGTRLWAARRIGGVILSSNGAMAGGGATFQAGDIHLYTTNTNKLMLEGKRPDGTRFLAEVTLANITNPA